MRDSKSPSKARRVKRALAYMKKMMDSLGPLVNKNKATSLIEDAAFYEEFERNIKNHRSRSDAIQMGIEAAKNK